MALHLNGTVLVFARTDTAMFGRSIWPVASAVFFFDTRLTFYSPAGKKADQPAGSPSCLIAYGEFDACVLDRSAENLGGKFLRIRGEEFDDG